MRPAIWLLVSCLSCLLASCSAEPGDPTRGGLCRTEADCDEGFSCGAGGECIATGACDEDLDCGVTEVCTDGGCVTRPPCTTDAECAAGQACSSGGRCITAGTCIADADCGAAMRCSMSGACIAEGACAVNGDCAMGLVCDPGPMMCIPGSDCGATELDATAIPPNLHIVLDRSCSMRRRVSDGRRKWEIAVEALNGLLTTYTGQVRWGLILFPDRGDGAECRQRAPIPVPLGDGNEATIQMLLTAALATGDRWWPDGPCVTNIDTAMEQAEMDPALIADMTRDGYVMLVTDGKQSGSCGGNARDPITEATIARLFAAGIPTFVVGFGGEVDPANLDQFAVAGGVPLPGMPRYHQADDAAMLAATFGDIVSGIVTCDYVLPSPPADLDMTYVFFDDRDMVPRDTTRTDGWDYDPATMTVTFYGSWCDRLQSGGAMDVDIVFGCPGPVLD